MYLHNKLQTSPYIVMIPKVASSQKFVWNLLSDSEYAIDDNALHILKFCKCCANITELFKEFGQEKIKEMFYTGLLVDPDSIWEMTNIKRVEIEISTVCNWRCRYCPQSVDPKSKKIMDMTLFTEIIDKAVRHKNIEYVTLNSYNEPTLDQYFEERVRKIALSNLKLILHCNGSMLDEKKVKLLKDLSVLSVIYFNLPCLNESEFKRLTGSSTYEQTIRNIDNAISSGLNVEFSIQGTPEELKGNLKEIKEKYGLLINKPIKSWGTNDRAGIMNNNYANKISVSGPLYGCSMVINWLHVGVNGDCFICCNDYYQKEVYGNLRDGELSDILRSEKAQLTRKRVFGAVMANENYICRRCADMQKAKYITQLSKDFRPILRI